MIGDKSSGLTGGDQTFIGELPHLPSAAGWSALMLTYGKQPQMLNLKSKVNRRWRRGATMLPLSLHTSSHVTLHNYGAFSVPRKLLSAGTLIQVGELG